MPSRKAAIPCAPRSKSGRPRSDGSAGPPQTASLSSVKPPPTAEYTESTSRLGPVLVAVEAVAHPVLDLRHGDAGARAQLDRALADGDGVAARIAQLDPGAGSDGQLPADLDAHSEPRLQLFRLAPRARFGRVSV